MLGSTHGRPTATATRCACLWAGLALLAVPSAVWAVAPDMLPSSAIWYNFMQKIREPRSVQIHEEDTDGDGVADFKVYRHEDGAYIDVKLKPGGGGMLVDTVRLRENLRDERSWVYGFDKNGDGVIDMVVRGMFAEGKWSQMLYDSDLDGRPDKFLVDIDLNGVYDGMGTDEDADGRLDYLYDLDNKTGDILNETVGWVVFKEQQRREAMPQLVYSFVPELRTLGGQEPIVISARWDYGDGAVREAESLVPGEHLYAKPGNYEIDLEVQFRIPGSEKVYRAWSGISLQVQPAPPGPAPLTVDRLLSSVNTFYGACGLITAEERPRTGLISELWPEVTLPEGAPSGNALRATAVAADDLDLAVFWWRSEAEADAFLSALESAPDPKPYLPALAVRAKEGRAVELVSKVRGRLLERGGVRTVAWREGPFIVTVSTNRPAHELERWARLLYDILHPAVELNPSAGS